MLALLFFFNASYANEEGDRGAAIYKTYCAGCHGGDGTGVGSCADFVNDKSRLAKSDEELFLSIKNGIGYMPPYSVFLSDDDIKDVTAYIRKTFGKK